MKEPTMISRFRCGRFGKPMAGVGVLLFALILMATQAHAVKFDTGNPDFSARWDNTVTYSVSTRLGDPDPIRSDGTLSYGEGHNFDDGNRNFDTGLVMNRFDLLSELDLVYKKFGIRISGAAWYDFVYNTENDNDSPGTLNYSVDDNQEFNDETKRLHGRDAELLEAFTFGRVYLGDMTLRYRAGQFTQWWGDSFFFGANGVASGLAPVDIAKAATLPNTQLKELIRPIPQLSVGLQVTDSISFDAYYQFEWEPARFFGVGSYFSPVDLLSNGGEWVSGGADPDGNPIAVFNKTTDVEPDDSGQFGVMMKLSTLWADYGFYALRYHSKDFIGTNVLTVVPEAGPVPYQYYRYYPEDIEAYAVSGNTAIGLFTYAAEVTYRRNVPLATRKGQTSPVLISEWGEEPKYPTGETLHVNINTFSPGLPATPVYDSMDFVFEVGWATCLNVDENEEMVDPSMDSDNLLVAQMVLEPKWYQVLPGLEVHMPLGLNYGFEADSKVVYGGGYPVHKGGDFNIGLYGLYNNLWEFAFTYRNYFGSEIYDGSDYVPSHDFDDNPVYTIYQPHADRDYVSFYIRRSF